MRIARLITPLVLLLHWSVFSQSNWQEVSTDAPHFQSKNARGVAVADFDNDGLDDIVVAAEPIRLLRNQGNFVFSDHTMSSGVEVRNTNSVILFDSNNDGTLDLFAAGSDYSRLYLNDGSGHFTSVASFSAVRRQSVNVGDLNGDSWPDIYSANFQNENNIYINQGSGRFVNAFGDASTQDLDMGAILLDIEEDGDLDIYLTYDGDQPNDLLVNDGTGSFNNEATSWKLDNRSNAMGVDAADFNGDGALDFFIANLWENDLLLYNSSTGRYEEKGTSAGVDDYGMAWGTVCFDYNNDGLTDIFFNNEYAFSSYDNQLLKNNGDETFTVVSAGTPLTNRLSGYGCAVGDFNKDGAQDLVLVNLNETNSIRIFKNENGLENHWVKVSLIGRESGKYAIGAKLKVYSGSQTQRKDVTVGSGYRSQNSYVQHFGLGGNILVDSIEVSWPSGHTEVFKDLPSNTHFIVEEFSGLRPYDQVDFEETLADPVQLPDPILVETEKSELSGNKSIAYEWIEVLLEAIRGDFARPTVHARNLFHISLAMYDAWAVFDDNAETVFLGKNFHGFQSELLEATFDGEKQHLQEEALSYAAYSLLKYRFANSPSTDQTLANAFQLMQTLGFDPGFISKDYQSGNAAALGIYLADKIIEFGLQDGSNEQNDYANRHYTPTNPPLEPELPGNPDILDPNRWQPLKLTEAIDQSGQPVAEMPDFLSPEWGRVVPFALEEKDRDIFQKEGFDYWVYHDPGPPPMLDENPEAYGWNFEMVSKWSAHLSGSDATLMDISPASIGNISAEQYPATFEEYVSFYPLSGEEQGQGYEVNPATGLPYDAQLVPRGDYGRVLAEFWADGPDSETPPGHWFSILNYVIDHPNFEPRFMGRGPVLSQLEWEVKAYMTLGGAMHDAAVTAWGIKGHYDYIRPISAIRYMASKGQSTSPDLPNYHVEGIGLLPGWIETITGDDPLAGIDNEHVGEIKLKAWKGPDYINDPAIDAADVGWIRAENWWPYQRPTFVTPPFAGYISGHSTFSSAAAEVLSQLTGSEYFPGGMGTFFAPKNEFLVFEEGPTVDMTLQWAKFKDAADQCSLSRIWGGIHPPVDDIPGRIIGKLVGYDAFEKARSYFNSSPLSVSEQSKQQDVRIYPNPVVRGGVWVQILSQEPVLAVNGWTISGQLVFSNLQLSDSHTLPWSFTEQGVYVIEIVTLGRSYVRKILVKK